MYCLRFKRGSADLRFLEVCGFYPRDSRKAADSLRRESLHCKVVISCFFGKVFDYPSPGPRRLEKAPAAVHPLPRERAAAARGFGCGRKAALRYLAVALAVAAISAALAFGQASTPAQPATDGLLLQAKQAELTHDFPAAAELYQKYLRSHPDQPEILQRLGLDFYLSGRFGGAIPVLAKAVKLDPSLWGSNLFLGISYYRTGRFSDALGPLQRALKLKPDLPEANLWLGSALLAEHEPESAVPYLQRASADARVGAQADSLLVQACRQAAESYYDRIAKLSPNSYRVDELKGQELAWEGTTVGALLQYQKALNLKPDLEGVHGAMGEIYWQQRQFALAAKEFQAELRLDPLDEESNRRLGEYWVAKGDPVQAISYLNAALAVHTQSLGEVYHFLGLADLSQGNITNAEAALKLAVRANPRERSNYRLLMQVYLRMGKTDQAAKERALFEKYTATTNR